jgi:hypothetical protein
MDDGSDKQFSGVNEQVWRLFFLTVLSGDAEYAPDVGALMRIDPQAWERFLGGSPTPRTKDRREYDWTMTPEMLFPGYPRR